MIWTDKQIWKQCFSATLLCLTGCAAGSLAATLSFSGYHWFFVLSSSLVSGFLSCIVLITVWYMLFRKISLAEALRRSYKMSFVSMVIMILSENFILFVFFSDSRSIHAHFGSTHDVLVMVISMLPGFLLAIPYNYYQVQKTGRYCH